MSAPRCSIVIPVHNRSDFTRRCVDALLEEHLDGAEIVVVDDGSVDNTANVLHAYGDRIRPVSLDPGRGFAGACNAGASGSVADTLLFLNNDTLPTPGSIETLLAYGEGHQEATVVGAKLLWPDGIVQHAGIVMTTPGWPHTIYRGFPADHAAVNQSRRMLAVTGACMLIQRDAFERVRGFDTAFRNGYEDVDLCFRIAEAGGEIHYCHEAVLFHAESVTRGPDGHGRENDPNLMLLLDRWRGRVAPDDISTYVSDGVIEMHYDGYAHPIGIKIDPFLATIVSEEAENTLSRLLNLRTRQVFTLLTALDFDAPDMPEEIESTGAARRFERPSGDDQVVGDAFRAAAALENRIAPLRLHITPTEPARINVLMASLDPARFSSDDVAILELLRRLRDSYQTRVVVIEDDMPGTEEHARSHLYAVEGLAGALGGVELVSAADRGVELRVNPSDRFVATSPWSARVAHAATAALGQPRFMHVIRDYEPLSLAGGAARALAEQAYAYPQVAAFSSELVRDFFADRGLGPYASGAAPGEELTLAFRPAIADAGEVTSDSLARREPGRVLVVTRPQGTDELGMFELAVLALRKALTKRALPLDFEFLALGAAVEDRGAIPLSEGVWLEMIPRQPAGRYRGLLRTHDIGISLRHTPRLGLAAVEMAAAGMVVVTNTYAGKTGERAAAVSSNIDAVEPTVDAIATALQVALARVKDPLARAEGARIAWPRSWDETFEPAILSAFARLLDRCAKR